MKCSNTFDACGQQKWQPKRVATDKLALAQLNLPFRFPHLFEQFLLSWRWLEVDVGVVAHTISQHHARTWPAGPRTS